MSGLTRVRPEPGGRPPAGSPSLDPPDRRLLLVRHAAADLPPGRCFGRTDAPLSGRGLEEAAAVARALVHLHVDAVLHSPLLRATATAQPIAAALDLQPVADPRLAEIDFGDFEGRAFDEIAATEPRLYAEWMSSPATVAFPNGESFATVKTRAAAAIAGLSGTTVAVSHAGPIRAILAALLGLPDAAVFRFDLSPASVSIIDWVAGVPILRGLNLPAEAASLARLLAPRAVPT